ncbi:hypothetical protein SETIT_5G207900v2 [Setaria italica]|uniref:Late embryogenesis abundant protein LEA-2 subgroup domain-containing protein n=1 Tax=Setaria italica TaxID=4555 RepID=A0A368R7C4_SETIT|nr:hypothetical protein SETIT_5G207900v2 [Setaria italica]
MGDRAYAGASKSVPVRATNGTANGGGAGGPPRPAPPSMLPGGRVPPPPMYRPKPAQSRPPPRRPRRSARGWCCACCLWLTLVLVGLVFLGAIAAGVFYVVYRPQPPSFAVTSLRLAALNVSDSDALTSRIDFTVTARNPNDKIAFAYGDIATSFSADGADVGAGVVPGFLHPAGNTTVIPRRRLRLRGHHRPRAGGGAQIQEVPRHVRGDGRQGGVPDRAVQVEAHQRPRPLLGVLRRGRQAHPAAGARALAGRGADRRRRRRAGARPQPRARAAPAVRHPGVYILFLVLRRREDDADGRKV